MNIWQILLTPIYLFLDLLLYILPDPDLGTLNFITSAGTFLTSTIEGANQFFPVTLFFTLLSIFFTIESLLLTFRVARYILSHLPFGLIK